MKSIKNEVTNSLIINKSEFINFLVSVNDEDEVNHKLISLKERYRDANHHCYAYIIGNNQEIQRFSDDGEPSRTAGIPMIDVLKKHGLTNVLAVSVRYFGGIKLGAGGLVRAYTKGVSETVKLAKFSQLVTIYKAKITVTFDHIGHTEKYLRDNFVLVDTIYNNNVEYYIEVLATDFDSLVSVIKENTKGSSVIDKLAEIEVYK